MTEQKGRRDRYGAVVRSLFAIVCIGGGISHLILGRVSPDGYAAFGETALFDWLRELWSSLVMPNIGWLTILLGIVEIAIGVGLLMRGRVVQWAAAAFLGFLAFIFILGYAFPTSSVGEDLLKNRVFTLVLMALMVPVVLRRDHLGVVAAWRGAR